MTGALLDGCEGDSDGLRAALGNSATRVRLYDNGEYEHACDTIWLLPDGRYIHAECGGCSCGGSGSWSYCASLEEAERLVPDHMKEHLQP